MPLYRAKEKGFHGRMYKPGETFRTDEPLGKVVDKKRVVPSWVELVKEETAAQKKKREDAEKKQALKDKQDAAQAEAAEAKQEREGAGAAGDPDFLGESAVETL